MGIRIDEVQNFLAFFKMPKALFRDERYKGLSANAKLMYMLLFDRLELSLENGWYDEEGEVYQYYTNQQLMADLNCGKDTIIKAKKELAEVSLLREVRQGQNNPNRLYVNGSIKNRLPKSVEIGKVDLGSRKNRITEVGKIDPIKTEYIKTNRSRLKDISSNSSNNTNKDIYNNIMQTSATATDKSQVTVFDYYQQRIGMIDGYQVEKIQDYLEYDKLEPELIKIAIDKAADNSKRSFGYINAILKGWAQNGIRTLVQQKENQREYEERKVKADSKHDEEKEDFSEYERYYGDLWSSS